MLRFAANLTLMFPELEAPARFAAAGDAGFKAVEYLRPYQDRTGDVRGWLDDAGLELILINAPSGNAEAGERGLAALPGRQREFRESLDLALEYAEGLGAGMIHVLAGVVPDGTRPEACEEVFVENLRSAADLAAARDVKLLLEPLNTRDAPGYLHTNAAHTRRIIEATGKDNVRLQFDLYHMQIMQGDLVESFRRNQDVIGHVQFSSVPGRNEPQFGEVNMPLVFEAMDALGYQGWLGCEYRPKGDTIEGLSWAKPYGIGPRRK